MDSSSFTLARTTDHGVTWTSDTLPLFEAGEGAAHSEEAGMGWLDAQTGWIVLKQSSSSNFSLGTLFTTSDGGNTWTRSGALLGAQIVGPEVGELIHELIAVMYYRGTVHDLLRMPHYHPTLAEIVTYPAESIAEQLKA